MIEDRIVDVTGNLLEVATTREGKRLVAKKSCKCCHGRGVKAYKLRDAVTESCEVDEKGRKKGLEYATRQVIPCSCVEEVEQKKE